MVGATCRKWPPIRRKPVAPYGRYLTTSGPAARDSIGSGPDAACPPSVQRRPVAGPSASRLVRGWPTPASSIAPSIPWKTQATALEGDDAAQRFSVTHPFHPLFQQTLELAARGREWGED